MKKMKKIMAAAIAMMTFSTAAAVTGTVAWFTASNIVSASGMSIQADTEQGILISNEGFATWKDSVVASHNGEITVEGATQQANLFQQVLMMLLNGTMLILLIIMQLKVAKKAQNMLHLILVMSMNLMLMAQPQVSIKLQKVA